MSVHLRETRAVAKEDAEEEDGGDGRAEGASAVDEVRKAGKEVSICEQWGLRAPLGAAELYREGSCCWRCLFPTSLMIRGHCPVFPDQQ